MRLAIRTLTRNPTFTIAALLALALGIGANTAVFSVVNAVLLRSLPYADADRVVRVYNHWEGSPRASISPAESFDYLDGTGNVFEAFGVYSTGAVNVTGGGAPERVPAAFASAGVLPALGVTPRGGRLYSADEDAAAATVVLASDGFVQRRFGGADVVGREIVVNGTTITIIGVLPPRFRLPSEFGSPTPSDLLFPLALDRATSTARGSHFLVGVARLANGVSPVAAERAIEQIANRFVAAFPDDYPQQMGFGVDLVDVRETVVGAVRPVLLLLLAAVGLVLLITCTNVASLLLARADARRREFAVRTALGAGRRHIASMVFAETGILATIAGILGVVLAAWATAGLVSLLPVGMATSVEIPVDLRVLAFATGTTLFATLLAGAAPLVGLGRLARDAQAALRESGRGTTTGRRRQRLRSGLVTAEVAIAVVLLVGAGLLLRSFAALIDVDPGYDTRNVLTTRISLPSAAYGSDQLRRDFFAELISRMGTMPGVQSAGAVTNLPLASSLGDLNFRVEGREVREGDVSPRLDWQVVTPGYFETMGMRIVRGRGITASDDERAAGAVVINETGARQYFPNEDPIGQRFLLGGGAGPGWVTIIGIAADIRHSTLAEPPRGAMYLAHRQFTFWNGGQAPGTMQIVVRAAGNAAALAPGLRATVRSLDPDLPISAVRTMSDVEAESLAQPRFVLVLIAAFAALALVLAAVGLYGLIAFVVGQRAHEIGVRMTLGASTTNVIGMVLRQAMTMVGGGIAIGLVGALLASQALRGLLFGVQPTDPMTLGTVAVALGIVCLAACIVPARRAAGVAPLDALRVE